jgi:FMN reductase
LVKNALDYIEELREDENPYLHARPVGSVATGAGWQGAVTTLASLRTIVHALRGWNTPLGVAVNTMEVTFSEQGECANVRTSDMLLALGREVAEVARARAKFLPGEGGAIVTPWGIAGHAPDDWF